MTIIELSYIIELTLIVLTTQQPNTSNFLFGDRHHHGTTFEPAIVCCSRHAPRF